MLLLADLHRCYCWSTQKLLPADQYRYHLSMIFTDVIACWPTNMLFLLTYKHVICCWPTNMLFLLTYKHVICCRPICTNKLFVADLQTCCTVLVAVIHRCYLLLFNTFHLLLQTYILDVICCWPTVVVYKHDICCWPTKMLFVADLHTCLLLIYKHLIVADLQRCYLLLTYTNVLYILWSNLGILQDCLEHRDQQVVRKSFLQRTRCKRLCMNVSTIFSSFLFIFQV